MKKFLFIALIIAGIALVPHLYAVSGGGGGGSTYTRTYDEGKLGCKTGNVEQLVRCRYELEENYLYSELTFLPAECSVLAQKERDDCLELYKSVQACWNEEGSAVEACLREKAGISDISREKSACTSLSCLYELREKVYSLVKLRMYSLEEKAEELEEFGVSKDSIIDVIVMLENAKIRFNNAGNINDRVSVVRETADAWERFRENARTQIMEAEGSN